MDEKIGANPRKERKSGTHSITHHRRIPASPKKLPVQIAYRLFILVAGKDGERPPLKRFR